MTNATRAQIAPLYGRHSTAADRGHWTVSSDIRWGDIDVRRAHRQPEVLRAVRSAVRELSARGVHVARMLLPAIRDVHACAVLTLDMHDGLKHFHALRTYLDTVEFTPTLSDDELTDARDIPSESMPLPEDSTSALVACFLSQHIASAHIRHLCARAEEPVLAELLSLIAADEARHARIVRDLIALRVDAEPAAGTRVLNHAQRLRIEVKRNGAFHGFTADDVAVQAFMRAMEALSGSTCRTDPTPRAALSP